MIVISIVFLLVLNLFILGFCVYILATRQKEKPIGSYHAIQKPFQSKMHNAHTNYDLLYENEKKEIQLKYPEIRTLFQDIPVHEGMVLHFQGLSQKKESIVYLFYNIEAKQIFLKTVQQFIQEAKTPKYNIVIAIPYTSTCQSEILSILKAKGIQIHALYTDLSCIGEIPNIEGKSALVGIGRKPFAIFDIKSKDQEYDWFSSLNSYDLFAASMSTYNRLAMKEISKSFPFVQKMQLYLIPLFSKQLMEYCMHTCSETMSWFLPVFSKREDKLIVYAPNAASLKVAIETVKKHAKKSHIDITLSRSDTKSYVFDLENEEYAQIHAIIQNTMHVQQCIDVLIEDDTLYTTAYPIISFAPLFQNHVISEYSAMRFYTQLLQCKKTSE